MSSMDGSKIIIINYKKKSSRLYMRSTSYYNKCKDTNWFYDYQHIKGSSFDRYWLAQKIFSKSLL